MPTHLVHATSPYLLQHAGNPVDWYPWGTEALSKATAEDKPIFLSIGYAACHWCHVMAHESFEDLAIAEMMNAHFVSIKVDREERPDLDSIYMDFVVALTGSGGWPMSVFLTPDGKPFYGGTYFPPSPRNHLPSFRQVLEAVARLWRDDRSSLEASSEELAARIYSLTRQPGLIAPASPVQVTSLSSAFLDQAAELLARGYDWQDGGWGGAPKFPQPMLLEFLLQRASLGDRSALAIATHSLNAMAQGGMYDILGGGFSRYSVDPTWLVPHFEKMLYDNAQLASVYLHAFQLTGEQSFREVCQATLDFVLRELTHPMAGFFSSLDADSEGEEGKFYLWTPGEIYSALPESSDADLFMAAYGVTGEGNFEGRNILRQVRTDAELANQFHLPVDDVHVRLIDLRSSVLRVRSTRVRPTTDDKVLVSWNAMMLAAFAEAGVAFGRQDYLSAAISCASFLLQEMHSKGGLFRSWREGTANQPAFLEDYASLALALISLYQANPEVHWYEAAFSLLQEILEHFSDPDGGFYDTSDAHETLIVRPREMQDNATPSGNALAALLLLKMAAYEGRSDWRDWAESMLNANLAAMERYPSAFACWLQAASFSLAPVHQVAILGDPADPARQALLNALRKTYHPHLVIACSAYPPPAGSPALLQERPLLNDKPTAYVCQGFVCKLPVNTPPEMLEQIQGA